MSGEYFIKSFEWCTKLPGENCSLEMNISLQQGCECLFQFLHSGDSKSGFYYLYVEVKSGHSRWVPCVLKLRVGFKNEQNLSLGASEIRVLGGNSKERIWCISKDNLRKKLPSDYGDGNWIKFQFCFEDMVGRKVEDKYLQTASYLNDNGSAKSLIDDLAKLLDTGINHDAEIKSGELSIKVHKNILCIRSEVFKAMLQGDMVEGRTGVVEIQDMDRSHVQDFVRYLYTEKMPELTFEKAKILYEAGDKYAVQSLMLRCSQFLQDNLTQENVFECLALGSAHSDEKLKNSVIEFSLMTKMYLEKELWLPVCERYPEIAFEVCRLSHANFTGNKGV